MNTTTRKIEPLAKVVIIRIEGKTLITLHTIT